MKKDTLHHEGREDHEGRRDLTAKNLDRKGAYVSFGLVKLDVFTRGILTLVPELITLAHSDGRGQG